MDMRVTFARWFAQGAGICSRMLGRGSGKVIGGAVAQKIDPHITSKLAAHTRSAIVTGTNGKSTTTAFTSAALETLGEVATNTHGDNMERGILVALLEKPRAQYAALEVDELYAEQIAKQIKPEIITLLNLSADQTDRTGTPAKVAQRIRQAVENNPNATIIANCDDPLIVYAAQGPHANTNTNGQKIVWVAAGCNWKENATECYPNGETPQRPEPHWSREGDTAINHNTGERTQLNINVPGEFNKNNALMALATAVEMGAEAEKCAESFTQITSVSGRYEYIDVPGEEKNAKIRMLLAKNPAGWKESMASLNPDASAYIFAVNARVADGKDTNWLNDVVLTNLAETSQPIYIAGEAAPALARAMDKAGVKYALLHSREEILDVVKNQLEGNVDFLGNYTAFQEFRNLLKKSGKKKAYLPK